MTVCETLVTDTQHTPGEVSPSVFVFHNDELVVSPMTVAIPVLSDSPAPQPPPTQSGGFSVQTILQNALRIRVPHLQLHVRIDIFPFQTNGDRSHHPAVHESLSLITGEINDGGRSESELSSATECFVISSSSGDTAGTSETTPSGDGSPHVGPSSRERLSDQACRSGLGGTLVRLDAIDALQLLSQSDERISSPPTGQGAQVPDQPISLPSVPIDAGAQGVEQDVVYQCSLYMYSVANTITRRAGLSLTLSS